MSQLLFRISFSPHFVFPPLSRTEILSTATLFIILWCEPPRFCSEVVSAANFPPSPPVVSFFSLSSFWPRCRLWHHFVHFSPIPPFPKSERSRLLCSCSYRQTGKQATSENVSVLRPSLTAALIAEGTVRCLLKLACAVI